MCPHAVTTVLRIHTVPVLYGGKRLIFMKKKKAFTEAITPDGAFNHYPEQSWLF